MTRHTYALIVGVTQYDPTILLENNSVLFPELFGCISDGKKLTDFLAAIYPDDQLSVKQLFNENATKENICKYFLEHLGQAGKDDSVLFYYSGHGTQEYADDCFTWETDGKLESIVSYYNKSNKDNCFISDKELRWLVNKVASKGCHLTIVLDCCHSGDATRAAEMIISANYERPIEKKSRGSFTFSKRPWENFIFHNEISPEDVRNKGILNTEGPHVLFSACKPNESAFEISGEGVFTKHLLKVLKQSNALLSNQRLMDSIAVYMDTAFRQKPRVYAPPAASGLLHTGFLNKQIGTETEVLAFFNVTRGWMINRGELNGMSEKVPSFYLIDPDNPGNEYAAKIIETEIDKSVLKVVGDPDKEKTYHTSLSGLIGKPIQLFLNLGKIIPADADKFMDQILPLQPQIIKLVEQVSDADYIYHCKDDIYFITRAIDPFQPVTEAISEPDSERHAAHLKHIFRWESVKKISGKHSNHVLPLKIRYKMGDDPDWKTASGNQTDSVYISEWNQGHKGQYRSRMQIRITNESAFEIHVGVLYLDINFGSQHFLLNPSPYQLNPGESVDLAVKGNPVISLTVPEQILLYNAKQYEETLKFIVSDQPFELFSQLLDPLPEPPAPMGVMRGAINEHDNQYDPVFKGWYHYDLKLIQKNPVFNQISYSRLISMLENDVTAVFAEQIYFDIDEENESLTPKFVLKPGIEIVQDDGHSSLTGVEKSVVIDLANWYARRKRNRHYEKIIRQFPDRMQVVSEGDSWFQHPLVYDTIDHLSNIYAIRCVAAAGDTLSNYLSAEKKNGEYFLDVIEQIKPRLFLISGGGNDILGSQFRDFLVDKPYTLTGFDRTDPARFLKSNFSEKLDALMLIYEQVFSLLKTRFPEMKTIVHGYDYPIHLDQTRKGWLGRYMIEKGISEHDDRAAVIRYIMDRFNSGLAKVVEKYSDTVRYLDLRGTIKYRLGEIDQWYDEIHPNKEGFQLISLKYVSMINSFS